MLPYSDIQHSTYCITAELHCCICQYVAVQQRLLFYPIALLTSRAHSYVAEFVRMPLYIDLLRRVESFIAGSTTASCQTKLIHVFPLYKRLPTGPANCDSGLSSDGGGDTAGPVGPPLTSCTAILTVLNRKYRSVLLSIQEYAQLYQLPHIQYCIALYSSI
jgi:hypothetical protein